MPTVSQAVLDSIEYNRANPRSNVRVPIPTVRSRDQVIHNMSIDDIIDFVRTAETDWSPSPSPSPARVGTTQIINPSAIQQQMSNLTLRSRREALVTRRSALPASNGPRQYISTSQINAAAGIVIRDHVARVPQFRRSAQSATNRVQSESQRNNADATTAEDSREQPQSNTASVRIQQQEIQSFFETLNEQFLRGNIAPPNPQLQDFNGFLTRDLATMIGDWLLREHFNHSVVQAVFIHSRGSSMDKVLHLLRQCGIEMQTSIRGTKIKRQQSLNLLLLLTYLLHAVGYNNTYFIPD